MGESFVTNEQMDGTVSGNYHHPTAVEVVWRSSWTLFTIKLLDTEYNNFSTIIDECVMSDFINVA